MNQLNIVIEAEVTGSWMELESTLSTLGKDVEANEPNTLGYESYMNEEAGKCWFVENYATPEAFVEHFGRVQNLLGKVMEHCTITNVLVFGEPTDEIRAILGKFGPSYGAPWTGYTRIGVPSIVA